MRTSKRSKPEIPVHDFDHGMGPEQMQRRNDDDDAMRHPPE
jgi:hypothetical protein